MLNFCTVGFARRQMKGFSLVEMMIALALGLVVVTAAIALIVSINQANSETIQSTRLTQELRTLAAVIANDIKRARRVDDPLANVGQGATVTCAVTPKTPAQPCYPITPPFTTPNTTATCATYGYTGTTTSATLYNYHSIRHVVAGGVGSVELTQLTFDPNVAAGTNLPSNAVITHCDSSGGITGGTATTLSSDQIDITALTFTAVNADEIDLTVSGRFRAGDAYTRTITRTFTQPIFIRSVSVN